MSQGPPGREVVAQVSGLHKVYGSNEVLRGVDLDLHKGEVIVVFGRSGSGKSTFLRCLNFLEDPTSGTIEIAGERLGGGHRTRRKREQIRRVRLRVGVVFQQFNLFPHMTTLENVMAGPLALKRGDQRQLAERLGIGADEKGELDRAAVKRRALELLAEVG